MKIMFVSLGCDKNLVDTEKMIGQVAACHDRDGQYSFSFTDDEYEADVIVINTCCFIGDAKEESINTIIEYGALKGQEGASLKYLICAGCLVKRYRSEMLKELPEVDGLIDLKSLRLLPDMIFALMNGQKVNSDDYLTRDPLTYDGKRNLTTGGYYAYLKIADGCDKRCTYCVIPYVRGSYVSVPMEEVIKEAEDLAARGVAELILVAQETTCYGKDLYGGKKLSELLHELCKVEGIRWIRLLYCYPEEITEDLIRCIKEEPKVLHYLDMPIQHSSDPILRAMGRRTNRREITERIQKLREEIPDIAIRTTMITGFPGETEEDFEDLLDFIRTIRFDRLGVFPYSLEENTAAALMEGQVPQEVKEERRDSAMQLQQEIAFSKAASFKGRVLDVMVEGKITDEDVYVGRSYLDAPGVDGFVFFSTERNLMSGEIVKVLITGSDEYDLIGELSENELEFTE